MSKKEAIKNYIPISRRIFEHPFWCEERVYSRFEAWIYLIKEARFEESEMYFGNKVIKVNRGQIFTSIRFLAEAWDWSVKKVRGFLDLLVSDKMITKGTPKGTPQTVITICNYDKYNFNGGTKGTPKGTGGAQAGHSEGTNKKNANNGNSTPPIIPPSPEEGGDADEAGKTWRDDYNIYLVELDQAFHELLNDQSFLDERQKYHPALNIRLSLEKAYNDYWRSEAAWKRRKASKTKSLNWKATFQNALTQRYNQVYLQKGEKNETEHSKYYIP